MNIKLESCTGNVLACIEIRPKGHRATFTHWPVEAGLDATWSRADADYCVELEVAGDWDGATINNYWAWWYEPCRLAEVPAVLGACLAKLRGIAPPESTTVSTAELVGLVEVLIAAAVAAVEKVGEPCT